jgi:rRNA-processing protein FCF1
MLRVILDSNFLFVPFQLQIDIFEEIRNKIGNIEFIVLSTTLQELEILGKKRSYKLSRQASSAFKLANRCKIVKVEKKPEESYDEVILRKAQEWNYIVATNDMDLRKKLRTEGIPVLYIRQKSHIEMEGIIH